MYMNYVDFFIQCFVQKLMCALHIFSAVLCSCLSARAVNYFSRGEYNDVFVYSWLCVTDLTSHIFQYRVTLFDVASQF